VLSVQTIARCRFGRAFTVAWEDACVATTFATRFAEARSIFGPLVWGLDPSTEVLEQWGVEDSPAGLERFVDIAIEAVAGTVGLIKPQSAFFERHGWEGIRALGRLMEEARSAGLLVILDVKRGDVGSTNDAYAEAYLGVDAALRADAMTVHPYLGFGAMGRYIELAARGGSCLLVVTRSSNPDGRSIQSARVESGRSVEADLLDEIGRQNADLAPAALGPIGAVVGPTLIDPELDLRSMNGLFLAPGVGAQGASPDDVARVFHACPERVMPSASRSLLVDGPDPSRLRDVAAELAETFRQVLAT